MTEADAEAERKSIEAELAKEKGLDPETGEPVKKESVAQKDEEPVKDPEKKSEEEVDEDEPAADADKEKEPVKEPEPARAKRYVPLPKFQELKRIAAEKDAKIAELQATIDQATTAKAEDARIKEYAEKHGMTEEAVRDLLNIRPAAAVAPKKAEPVVEKSAEEMKQEAEASYQTELVGLLEEIPEAKGHEDKIREAAFKKGNETKSLFEIFVREIKPTIPAKKKTGEQSRGAAGRDADKGLDFAQIAADLKAGKPMPKDMSGEDQDKLFAWMDKNGSRYTQR